MSESWVRELRVAARRHAGRRDEADDLVQAACLAAVEAGRTDFTSPETQAWLRGVLRNKARMTSRGALRQRARETRWANERGDGAGSEGAGPDLTALPRSLRVTALLSLNGATRAEIGWLLGLSDAALRQRISQLKRAIDRAPDVDLTLQGALPFGVMRRTMLERFGKRDGFLASHDPDGHFFVLACSQKDGARQHRG
ncbi:MAG: transcriptional regulator [Henriciella sp.]|jgi:RNA polymerase sigma-70 factor (ECF subfamily)|uniref:RNA polymerase sigma factor n=1 Tax=Henriciella sp. TaxID=1968823 RepID=UPI000C0E60E8|nr:sigma factor [Henriciella sp.]MAN75442.1 transcriptional regulator [Henriciella sp.]MBF34933.1 transcriptional regulator [Hyphomonadaceae bacterium]MBK74516.1 transcriptional regulator [Henriciella sp.]PHR70462.1 MAG: transcriptional regulator [Henriciella sp.]|tara:strand:+ start:1152 stop:1745 length:594 start_codon:yes stop_codon:yes gene_type:complete